MSEKSERKSCDNKSWLNYLLVQEKRMTNSEVNGDNKCELSNLVQGERICEGGERKACEVRLVRPTVCRHLYLLSYRTLTWSAPGAGWTLTPARPPPLPCQGAVQQNRHS